MTNVLVTACGCPGGPSVIRALKEPELSWGGDSVLPPRVHVEKGCRVVGTDCSASASGRHFADAFYQVPKGNSSEFVSALLTICKDDGVDAVLPQSSHEVMALAENRKLFEKIGITVLVSNPNALGISLDKAATYHKLRGIVPLPDFCKVWDKRTLRDRAQQLGYYLGRPIVVKPAVGKGGKGFRLVKQRVDRSEMDMHRWPNSHTVTLEEIKGPWPLMVMEHLSQKGNEADAVDLYGTEFGVTKIRSDCRMGVHYKHDAKWDQELWDQSVKVVEALGLEHFVNIQWMGSVLLEVNPRISTNFYPKGSNYVLAGVKAALGLPYEWERPPDGTITRYTVDNHTRGY